MPKEAAKKENPLLSKNIPSPPPAIANPNPDLPQYSNTAQYGNAGQSATTVIPQNSALPQSSKPPKITLYPTPEQADRLYDLMEAYRKRTGIRVNQQDVLRRLIEVATIDMLIP